MKKPSVYYQNSNGKIWLVEDIEHHPKLHSLQPFGFSIILKGNWDGRTELRRCLVRSSQFKNFIYSEVSRAEWMTSTFENHDRKCRFSRTHYSEALLGKAGFVSN